ncbi:MAG: hypothetical protein ABSH01_10520 [Terriglobia bacterium]|jgi:hypothetical protein
MIIARVPAGVYWPVKVSAPVFRFSETETGERKELVLPRLERVAPELALPPVEISWTARELESLADLASREPAHPTETLLRAMRG